MGTTAAGAGFIGVLGIVFNLGMGEALGAAAGVTGGGVVGAPGVVLKSPLILL